MKYLIIAKVNGSGTHISFTADCRTTNSAIRKAMKYCDDEGYFVNEIKVIENNLSVDLGKEETFWLQVEMYCQEIDEYAPYEYEVPIDWLREHVNDLKTFIDEYIADETTGLYDTARRDGVILNEHWIN